MSAANAVNMSKDADIKQKSLKTPLLEVRGKTLIFDNSIFQIPNISALEVGKISKPIPRFFWVLLVFSFGAMAAGLEEEMFFAAGVGGFILTGIVGFSWAFRVEYGLIVRLNSGYTHLLVSKELDFLKTVAAVLQNVMNNEQERSLTINLDKRTIIDNVSNSNVVAGNSSGDIVNRVER